MNEERAGRGPTVLVLDDEVAGVIRRILERSGYRVLTAVTAQQALDVVTEVGGDVDLLICDLVLPGLGGREAANAIRARAPGVKVLYTSGFSSHDSFRRDLEKSGEPFIGKPFEAAALIEAVEKVLGG